MKTFSRLLFIIPVFIISLIEGHKEDVSPSYQNFVTDKYIGTWYQVARIENHLERGYKNVSTCYKLNADGHLSVTSRSFDSNNSSWRTTEGYAIQRADSNKMKVYFAPLIGMDRNVSYVDQQYTIAVVTGSSSNNLWLYSRTPKISEIQRERLLTEAYRLGYNTSRISFETSSDGDSDSREVSSL